MTEVVESSGIARGLLKFASGGATGTACVGVYVGVGVAVAVFVGVYVAVAVLVGVFVAVGALVGVLVGVAAGFGVAVFVAVAAGAVGLFVGLGLAADALAGVLAELPAIVAVWPGLAELFREDVAVAAALELPPEEPPPDPAFEPPPSWATGVGVSAAVEGLGFCSSAFSVWLVAVASAWSPRSSSSPMQAARTELADNNAAAARATTPRHGRERMGGQFDVSFCTVGPPCGRSSPPVARRNTTVRRDSGSPNRVQLVPSPETGWEVEVPEVWYEELKRWRAAEGLSRAELARRAGVSIESLKAYELGRRKPSREVLKSLLDHLRVERGHRSAILDAAGYAPGRDEFVPSGESYGFTVAEAQREVDLYPWPSQVNNELMEVVAANRAALALWSAAEDEPGRPVLSNMMAGASHPRFGGRIRNWEEVVAVGVGIMKGHPRGNEPDLEGLSPYFAGVLQQFLSGEPAYVARLLHLWEGVEPRSPKARWTVPVIIDHPDQGELRFVLVSSVCNEPAGLFFADWIPQDGRTWGAVAALAAMFASR